MLSLIFASFLPFYFFSLPLKQSHCLHKNFEIQGLSDFTDGEIGIQSEWLVWGWTNSSRGDLNLGILVPALHQGDISPFSPKPLPLPFFCCCCLFRWRTVARKLTTHMDSSEVFFRKSLQSVTSVAQSCPTLCDLMNHSKPGLHVHHQLPEFTQTHVHQVSDATQPSHPLSSPSPPAPNPSQYQGLY